MPQRNIGQVARFSFHAFTVPLVYSTIAIAVTIETIGDYWFVLVGAFVSMGMSYVVATLMRCVIPIANERDFQALRVCVTYPNIMALPILIFPSLCEFSVVHEGFVPHDKNDPEFSGTEYLESQCVSQATTMIFIYFFSWSLCLWSFGVNSALAAARLPSGNDKEDAKEIVDRSNENSTPLAIEGTIEENRSSGIPNADVDVISLEEGKDEKLEIVPNPNQDLPETKSDNGSHRNLDRTSNSGASTEEESASAVPSALSSFCVALKQTTSSPAFISMVAAFITACIPPLQEALFEGGGPIRFFGSAMETLGLASSPMATMVVAASLVPPRVQRDVDNEEGDDEDGEPIVDENPIMSDPTVGPYQRRRDPERMNSRFRKIRKSLRSSSVRVLKAMPRPSKEMMRLHVWFCLSRLIISPLIMVILIISLDCGGNLLSGVPALAKFVLIVNSALPGAQTIIVVLKSNEELSDTADALAKVYMPSYILSIVTIAVWTSVGLWVTLPDEDGNSFCHQA